MTEAQPDDGLLAWGLGTFHATLFLATLVLVASELGLLPGVLGALDTVRGLTLFAVFWMLSWWSARRALRDLGGTFLPREAMAKGGFWGGVTGAGFFLALLVLVAAPFVPHLGTEALPFLALVLLLGSAVAFVTGMIFGCVFAAVDLLLVALARRLLSGWSSASTG